MGRDRSNICQLCGTPGSRGMYGIRPVQIVYSYENGKFGNHSALVCQDCRRGGLVGSFHFKDAIRGKSAKSKKNKHLQKESSVNLLEKIEISEFESSKGKDEKFIALVRTDDGLVSIFYFDGKERSRADKAGKCSILSNYDILLDNVKEMLKFYPDGDFRIFGWYDGDKISANDRVIPEIMKLPKVGSFDKRYDRYEAPYISRKVRKSKRRNMGNVKMIPVNSIRKGNYTLYFYDSRDTRSSAEALRHIIKNRGYEVKITREFIGDDYRPIWYIYTEWGASKKGIPPVKSRI